MTTVGVALIGSGRMGAFHAETLARRVPRARLAAIADPARGAQPTAWPPSWASRPATPIRLRPSPTPPWTRS